MCHTFLNDTTFYSFLTQIDQHIADEAQRVGCPYCGGVLHVSDYPRKPRGIRKALDESYQTRLSFCCAEDGCRRRLTPPSVRFLGRKVYLSVFIILLTALTHGLTPQRRQRLVDELDVPPQTLSRWRHWWRETFAVSRCWRRERGLFMPPVTIDQLPGECLGRLRGDLRQRLFRFLALIAPVTSRDAHVH